MFADYYFADQVERYRASPHKARIDHVAQALVSRQYLKAVAELWSAIIPFPPVFRVSTDSVKRASPAAYHPAFMVKPARNWGFQRPVNLAAILGHRVRFGALGLRPGSRGPRKPQ